MPNLNRASQATAGSAGRRPERRRCLRRKMLESGEMVPVDLGPMETGLLLDISAKGASVQGPNPLNPGLRLSLRFRLPDSEISVHPTYEVVWTEPGGKIGLRFLYMAEREQRQMEEWLVAHLPKPVPPASLQEVLPEVPGQHVPEPPATPVTPVPDLRELSLGTEVASLTLATALSRVVEQAHTLTQADGAAIALREGTEIICRASCGNAPDVGMALNPESGLSGECIRTGRVVNCSDAANDARVDPSIAQQLNLRAALIVPVIAGETVTGLVEVLSSQPAAFTSAHQASLERMAAIVSFLTGPPAPEPEAENQQTEADATAERDEPGRTARPESQEPAPGKSLTAFHAEVSELIELLEPELAAVPERAKAEREPVHLAEPATATPPRPTLRAEPLPSFLKAPKRRLAPRGLLAIPAIALGLVLVSAAGWMVGSGRFARWTQGAPKPSAQPAKSGASAAPAGTQFEAAATTPPPPAVESKKTSAAPASTKARVPVIIVMPETPGPNLPPSDLAPSPTALGGATGTMPAIPAPAPVTPARGENGTRNPNASPNQPQRVAPELMHARLLDRTNPVYPPFARSAHISGMVVLEVLIGADGRVKSAAVVSGNPVLARAAQDAVLRWRYRSYVLRDKPVEVITTVRMLFSLPR